MQGARSSRGTKLARSPHGAGRGSSRESPGVIGRHRGVEEGLSEGMGCEEAAVGGTLRLGSLEEVEENVMGRYPEGLGWPLPALGRRGEAQPAHKPLVRGVYARHCQA